MRGHRNRGGGSAAGTEDGSTRDRGGGGNERNALRELPHGFPFRWAQSGNLSDCSCKRCDAPSVVEAASARFTPREGRPAAVGRKRRPPDAAALHYFPYVVWNFSSGPYDVWKCRTGVLAVPRPRKGAGLTVDVLPAGHRERRADQKIRIGGACDTSGAGLAPPRMVGSGKLRSFPTVTQGALTQDGGRLQGRCPWPSGSGAPTQGVPASGWSGLKAAGSGVAADVNSLQGSAGSPGHSAGAPVRAACRPADGGLAACRWRLEDLPPTFSRACRPCGHVSAGGGGVTQVSMRQVDS